VNAVLRDTRRAAGVTQEAMAEAIGIDRTAYCRIERGRRQPDVNVAIKIAALLGKSVEFLFDGECCVKLTQGVRLESAG